MRGLTPFLRRSLIPLVLLLSACGNAPDLQAQRFTLLAFGTLVTVEIVGTDRDTAVTAIETLEQAFAIRDRDWYAFGDGELARVNAALLAGEAVETTAELAALIDRSLTYRERSDGLFDPLVADLVELWGFADFARGLVPDAPPAPAALEAWRQAAGAGIRVRVTGRSISASRPVRLDLGGVAKGTLLNLATNLLAENGIENALVDAGGDVRVMGRRGDRRWALGIRDPFADGVIGRIRLAAGEAIVTSGNYERAYDVDGRRIHHVLDPRTGEPVANTAAVTVVHADAERADAAATALMVAGPDRFAEIAARLGIDTALLIDAAGGLEMLPAMRLRFEPAVTQ